MRVKSITGKVPITITAGIAIAYLTSRSPRCNTWKPNTGIAKRTIRPSNQKPAYNRTTDRAPTTTSAKGVVIALMIDGWMDYGRRTRGSFSTAYAERQEHDNRDVHDFCTPRKESNKAHQLIQTIISQTNPYS